MVIELFEAVNAGDVDVALDLFADRAEVTQLPALPGESGVYAGKRQVRGWLERLVQHRVKLNLAQEPTVSGNTVTGLVEQTTFFNEFLKIVNIEVLYGLFAGVIEMQARVGDGRVNALSLSSLDARYTYGGVILTPSRLEALHRELRAASGTVTFRDSDPDDFGDKLSDMAVITLQGVPTLPKAYGVAYELRFTSDDGSREAATTKVLENGDGSAEAILSLGGEVGSLTGLINELNESGQSGRYTMTASGDQTLVLIEVNPALDSDNEPQPIHIHFGQCGEGLGPHAFVRDITRLPGGLATGVEGGRLEAIQDVDLAYLVDGNHSVNMHMSYPNMSRYVACGDIPTAEPTGENLLAAFSSVQLTLGPGLYPRSGPSLAYSIPGSTMLHIRRLLVSTDGNPDYKAGFHQGLPKGTAVGLREQTWVARTQAGNAVRATSVAELRQHAESVANVIEGAAGPNYGDLDGSNAVDDAGDGFGILNYAQNTAEQASLAAQGESDQSAVVVYSLVAIDSASQALSLASKARDVTLMALEAADSEEARVFMERAEASLEEALQASKDAYRAAQDMGSFTLEYSAPGISQGPEPPGTGDPNVPRVALALMALGMLFLPAGAVVLRRSSVPSTRGAR